MSKLVALIAIIAITVSSVNATNSLPGDPVSCGTPNPGGASTDCTQCLSNQQIVQFLFIPLASPNCKYFNCLGNPLNSVNGLICQSCAEVTGAIPIFGSGKIVFDPTTSSCVATCPTGYSTDSYQNCQPNSGADVACGTASSANNPSTDCIGCGANNTVQALFKPSTTPSCKVSNCVISPGNNINSWMCKSCNGIAGAHTDYAPGKFFQGTACVSSCTGGYTPDATNTCQPSTTKPGADVGCGTAGTVGGNATNCNGCGANSTIQGLFQASGTPNCKVIDCSADPSSNLNGWICKSCNAQAGAHSAYANGQYFQGGACVSSCTGGQISDTSNTCMVPSVFPGTDVGCGTAGTAGGNAVDCNGCGANSAIQGIFKPSGTPFCKVTDCSANPSTSLNGWMCKSCNGIASAHSAYSAGKLLSETACVASCPQGQTADANNICQSGNDSTKTSSGFLTLAFTMLLLCLLF
ncbi:hypothetical protein ABPG72_020326 [Tetrahymena utriculariae]